MNKVKKNNSIGSARMRVEMILKMGLQTISAVVTKEDRIPYEALKKIYIRSKDERAKAKITDLNEGITTFGFGTLGVTKSKYF
jgi:hypothetical protein